MLRRPLFLALVLLAAPAAALSLPAVPCGPPRVDCALPDPSFETGSDGMPDGWAPYVSGPCDGQGVAATGAAARTGAWGMRVVDHVDQCTGFVSDPIPIVGGMQYNGSVWVRRVEGAPVLRIFVVWYANDGSVLEDYLYKDGFQKTPGPEWARLWSITDAPVEALTARVWVYAPMATGGTFDVDDAAFVSGPPSGPPTI